MTDVAARLRGVRARVDAACEAAGRSPSEVGLIAVSKRHPAAAIELAMAAGQLDFGENYAQELRDKAQALPPDVRWHFIGRVQSNKARYIGPYAARVHALEEVRHAEALVARAPQGVDALVYVDVAGEATKGGVRPEHLLERVRALGVVPGLRLRGLFCMPPAVEDPEAAAPWFAQTRELLQVCRADGFDMGELSMGMSHDFEVAIAHGATWVRVGTAIFGERPTVA